MPEEQRFWIFVDIHKDPATTPAYYVVPEWWIQNDIYDTHQGYLKRHGGVRRRGSGSTHHAIPRSRIVEWEGAWDQLGIS